MKGRAVLTKLITSFNYILAAKTKNWKILIFYRRIEKKKKKMKCLVFSLYLITKDGKEGPEHCQS